MDFLNPYFKNEKFSKNLPFKVNFVGQICLNDKYVYWNTTTAGKIFSM